MPDEQGHPLEKGDVVQLSHATNFPFCFMIVTEPKSFGAQGYIFMPQDLGEHPAEAHFRASSAEMTYIGKAAWINKENEET